MNHKYITNEEMQSMTRHIRSAYEFTNEFDPEVMVRRMNTIINDPAKDNVRLVAEVQQLTKDVNAKEYRLAQMAKRGRL